MNSTIAASPSAACAPTGISALSCAQSEKFHPKNHFKKPAVSHCLSTPPLPAPALRTFWSEASRARYSRSMSDSILFFRSVALRGNLSCCSTCWGGGGRAEAGEGANQVGLEGELELLRHPYGKWSKGRGRGRTEASCTPSRVRDLEVKLGCLYEHTVYCGLNCHRQLHHQH